MICDIQPPIDSKISDNVKFFGFLLDDKLSFQASSINLCRLLPFGFVEYIPSKTTFQKIHYLNLEDF